MLGARKILGIFCTPISRVGSTDACYDLEVASGFGTKMFSGDGGGTLTSNRRNFAIFVLLFNAPYTCVVYLGHVMVHLVVQC